MCNYAVGYDNVDVAAATELGIPVSNTPGVLTDTTADLAWALLLAAARQVPQAHAYTAEGRFRSWVPGLFLGADMSGEWRLVVSDGANADTGTLDNWSLEILTDAP